MNTIECAGCTKGINMCYYHPCMGTPEDLEKIIDVGYAHLLQLGDYFNKADEPVNALIGAVYEPENRTGLSYLDILLEKLMTPEERIKTTYKPEHNGGKHRSLNPIGKCAFLDESNGCSLHTSGLKPTEGKTSCCKLKISNDKDASQEMVDNLVALWDTNTGRALIDRWKQLVDYQDTITHFAA